MRKTFPRRDWKSTTSRWYLIAVVAAVLSASMVLAAQKAGFAQQSAPPPQYLLISEYDMAPGRTIADVIEESSGWVRDLRKTGEFNSVRLYIHNYGTGLRMYILHEPKSWQAIKNGEEKFFAARPDIFSAPFRWAGHSDNILTEIPVR